MLEFILSFVIADLLWLVGSFLIVCALVGLITFFDWLLK